MPGITRQQLIDHACAIAAQHGIAALTIRGLAQECGVSTGAVYLHFKTKSELSVAVIETFFRRKLFADFCLPSGGFDYLEFCKRVDAEIEDAMREFMTKWLRGAEALPAKEVQAAKTREAEVMEHIQRGLVYAFDRDPDIDRDALPEGVDGASISALVLDAIVKRVRGQGTCDAVFYLLERGLYRN
ncbi:TetR/AcrR family transcriptional regulator [Curtanaerobium respiraculi]|uniref:TetR/AcrR family transcriptional regulator n=1 Tax=Curtanaerobium respiraculi TaxID=2949669 RepID=UPI0024B32A0F|nr:TetR/AcrR family transcriptional regulator [Curtanaerobium respiraculi]